MNISSKELKKMARNQLSGKYGTFIGINVLYILITLVASNLIDLVLGTSSILNPLTATSATVETLGISHTVVYYLSTFILSLILSVLDIGLLKIALDTARGYDIRFQDLFYGFKHHPDRAMVEVCHCHLQIRNHPQKPDPACDRAQQVDADEAEL